MPPMLFYPASMFQIPVAQEAQALVSALLQSGGLDFAGDVVSHVIDGDPHARQQESNDLRARRSGAS